MNSLLSKKIVWIAVSAIILLIMLFGIEESRTFLIALFLRVLFFAKKYLVEILTAFFLVKGKFILSLFMKKIAMLSATGLGKRYLIEKVINHNLKIHFLDHISDDIKRLVIYVKENFKDFPIIKQIIAGITFLASLSFVGKFMGSMLAMKVFIAKFWSFILAIVLKFGTAIIYFFTDYLWGSWIAPIIEVLIFSWLLEWMEKIPFFQKYLIRIYNFFIALFKNFENYLEKVFHIPVKHFFKYLAKKIKKRIYTFIGYERISSWKRLQEIRVLRPNSHTQLLKKRNIRLENKKKTYISGRERVRLKREQGQ